LRCCDVVELVNEHAYTLVVEDEVDRSTMHGKTGHTVKLITCNFHILVLEDKAVGLQMGASEMGQTKIEMMYEVKLIDEALHFVPQKYCGILQNGISWILLFRKVRNGRVRWNYVVSPGAFSDGLINEKNCAIIARLVEHAYSVSDDIAYHKQTESCPRRFRFK
jgi:hypothetical protein